MEGLLASGTSAREVAFLSFTKAAVNEARDRASIKFGIDPEEFVHFRTIHSLAFQALGRRKVMSGADWKTFGETFTYSFSDGPEQDGALNFAEDGDCLRGLLALRRSKRCSTEEAILYAGDVPAHVTPAMVSLFDSRLTEWKREAGVIDFTDMLEGALAIDWRPGVRFAFVDEAQDNSRLQNALTKHWFWGSSRCEWVKYAGDDDQAIYCWSGADDGALVRLSKRFAPVILTQSYRVPRQAHALASSIIRENRNRVDKVYLPTPEEGEVVHTEGALDSLREAPGPALALVRNVKFAEAFREACLDLGRLFSAEVGPASPLDRRAIAAAFRAVASWRRGGNASAQDFAGLLDLTPSRREGKPLLPHGVKAKAKLNTDAVPVWRAREHFGVGALVDVCLRPEDPFALALSLPPEERRYLELVLARDPRLEGPRITITSIHRSKGRESPTVLVSPDMATRSWRRFRGHVEGREEERRVPYVAVTRTKGRLILQAPSERLFFDYDRHVA